MSEMIERVARAIAADNENWPYDRRPWSEQRYLRERAKAVLEAMREPTEAMLIDDGYPKPGRSVMGIWQAMIDVALSGSDTRRMAETEGLGSKTE